MSHLTEEIRRLLVNRSVAVLLGFQAVATTASLVAQNFGIEQIAYPLRIVPELAFILYALLGEVTGVSFLSVSNLLPVGIILLLTAYYFIAVVIAVPGRAVYRVGRQLTAG